MWNLLKLDIESVSSARAGGFLPTVPPGESCVCVCVCVCAHCSGGALEQRALRHLAGQSLLSRKRHCASSHTEPKGGPHSRSPLKTVILTSGSYRMAMSVRWV